ncbi:MAG TPA: hypothetical protein VN248_06740 [Arenimonas sp.]|nr:hypothetical protein [Arenimonas sp.]
MIRKGALLASIVLAHALALYWLAMATRYTPPAAVLDAPISISFILRERQSPPEPPKASPTGSPPVRHRPADERNTKPAAAKPMVVDSVPSTAPSLTLINKDGSVILPGQTRDSFLNDTDNRVFDVQKKGLDDMDKLLRRPQVMEYRETVFEKGWQGDRPPLERLLEKAVQKSTAHIKIPVPGRPGAYLRCSIAVLALGGGCGFTANDDGYFVRADDPETLSPEEDRQCAAWWDLIVSAKTQALWRKTRALYDQECRKPLAK